jgi:META domain-containing protein
MIVALLGGGARTARAESDLFELRGTFWHLDHLDGSSDDTSNIVVRVSTQTIDFSVPCLSISYPFGYESGVLKFAPPGRSSCQRAKSPVLSTVGANLSRINHHALIANKLTFLDDHDRPVIELSRIIETGLENQEWSIDQYSDGVNLVAVGRHASITFVNKIIDGSPGCGGLIGSYSLSGAQLKVWAAWLLGGYCPGDFEPQNNGVVKALSGERLVERDGQRVILRDGQGAAQIVLKP